MKKPPIILLLAFGFVALAPTILSTSFVTKSIVVPLINRSIEGTFAFEEMRLSWIIGQEVKQLLWTDSQGQTLLSIDKLEIAEPFWNLFSLPNRIEIQNLKANLSLWPQSHAPNVIFDLPTAKLNHRMIEIHGSTLAEGKSGKIDVSMTLPDELPRKKSKLIKKFLSPLYLYSHPWVIELENFPVTLADFIAGTDGLLTQAIGPMLQVSVHTDETQDQRQIQIEAQSEFLHAFAKLNVTPESLILPNPGMFSFRMHKGLIDAIQHRYPIPTLQYPPQLDIALKDLIWQQEGEGNLLVHFNVPSIQFTSGVELSHIEAAAEFSGSSSIFTLSLTPEVPSAGKKGFLKLQAIRNNYSLPAFSFKGDIVPSDFFQILFQEATDRNLMVHLLGPSVNMHGDVIQEKEQLGVSLNLESERVKSLQADFRIGDKITLIAPASLELNLASYFIQPLVTTPLSAHDTPLKLTLNELSMPAKSALSPNDIFIDGSILIEQTAFTGIQWIKEAKIQNLQFDLKNSYLSSIQLNAEGLLTLDDYLIGKKLLIDGLVSFNKNWELEIPEVTAKLEHHQTSFLVDLKKSLSPSRLQIGASFKTVIDPQHLKTPLLGRPEFTLNQPCTVNCEITNLEFDLDQSIFSHFKSKGELLIDNVSIGKPLSPPLAKLTEIRLPWKIDAYENNATINLKAKADAHEAKDVGSIDWHIDLHQWLTNQTPDWKNMQVRSSLNVKKLPTAILNLFSQSLDTSILLGEAIDIAADANSYKTENPQGDFDLSIRAKDLSVDAKLALGKTVTLKDATKPVKIEWLLTPEKYKELRKLIKENDTTTLAADAKLSATMTDLKIPLNAPLQSSGAITAIIPSLSFIDPSSQTSWILDENNLKFETGNISKEIAFTIGSKGRVNTDKASPSLLTLQGNLQRSAESTPLIHILGKAESLPVALILDLLGFEDAMSAKVKGVLGPFINGEIATNIRHSTGPLKLTVYGSIGSLAIEGKLSQGVLTLDKPLDLQLAVTPEVAQTFIEELVPLMGAAVSADKPIHLTVDPADFHYVWGSTDPLSINIGLLTLDLGKMYFKNEGDVAEILDLLKARSRDEYITAWFTPLYASMNRGIIKCQRMDILIADRYPIAFWGNIDLPDDKVRMKVGLTAKTLKRAFGLKGIPRDYVLQLPMKGTTSHAKIDSGKAITQITAFLAQFRSGPQGAILNGVMSLLGGEKKAPAPTTKPFPWETQNEEDEEEEAPTPEKSAPPIEAFKTGFQQLLKSVR